MADTDTSENQPPQEKEEKQDSAEVEEESDEWKAEKYRNKVVERIQDEITKTESQVPKSAADLEEFVFSKATTRKSYLDLVARILIYVAEFNKKKEKKEAEGGDKADAADGEKKEEAKDEKQEEKEKDS